MLLIAREFVQAHSRKVLPAINGTILLQPEAFSKMPILVRLRLTMKTQILLSSVLCILSLQTTTAIPSNAADDSSHKTPTPEEQKTEVLHEENNNLTQPTTESKDTKQALKNEFEALSVQPKTKEEEATTEEKAIYQKHYRTGAQLYQMKKYQPAIEELSKAAESNAEDGEAGILIGYCYYALKDYDKALKHYNLVANTGKLISIKNRAQKLYQTLYSYKRGICPGNCLKSTSPGWRKMQVAGHSPSLYWMKFPYRLSDGRSGYQAWTNEHIGEVIEYVNGYPINKGTCSICSGTGKVSLLK